MKRLVAVTFRCLVIMGAALFTVLAVVWSMAALYFDTPNPRLQWLCPSAFFFGILLIWITMRRRLLIACGLTLISFGVVCAWWLSIPPAQARDWQPDVAVTPYAEFQDNKVTLHNVRYCKYQSESDFKVEHYDKTFDLNAIRSVDLYLVYWGSPHIAHTMTSFGFDGDQYVCISIETRKEKGENYSALRGFFRQYELTYVIADERDVVRLRTNFRNEQVYLYRIKMGPEQARALFLEYLKNANALHEKPQWYNALTDNCTTGIRLNAQKARGYSVPLDWRVIVNGHSDEMLFQRGRIDTSLPFADLKKASLVNTRAKDASHAGFSQTIRRGLPGMN